MKNYSVIIALAGNSSRFIDPIFQNKSFLKINKIFYLVKKDKFILDFSIDKFVNDSRCQRIFLVYVAADQKYLKKYANNSLFHFVLGGATRQQSVYNALKLVQTEYVLIHDGARPFFQSTLISQLLDELLLYNAVIPYLKLNSALKQIYQKNNEFFVEANLKRDFFCFVQTPQAFTTKKILVCHNLANKQGNAAAVDDSALFSMYLHHEQIKLILDAETNIKITSYQDYLYGCFLLKNSI